MNYLTPVLFTVAVTVLSTTAMAQYEPGFVWDRSEDWDDGTVNGQSWGAGNPDDDAAGNRVWSYEYVVGGGDLKAADPWYSLVPQLLVWDPSWFGEPGLWAFSDDASPPIGALGSTHSIRNDNFARVPVMRWTNPAGDGLTIDIAGDLILAWSGLGGVGTDVDMDVVIAHVDKSEGTTNVLFSDTLSNPAPGEIGAAVTLPVDLQGVTVDAGDAIIISHRGREAVGTSHWLNLGDDITITLAGVPPHPCPADFDNSGDVGVKDLLFLLGAWGPCP